MAQDSLVDSLRLRGLAFSLLHVAAEAPNIVFRDMVVVRLGVTGNLKTDALHKQLTLTVDPYQGFESA